MRVPPGAAIGDRIEILEQHWLVRALRILVVPHVVRVFLACNLLINGVGIDHCYRNKVLVVHRACITNSERVFQDGLNGAPYL